MAVSAIEKLLLKNLIRGPQPAQKFNRMTGVLSGLLRRGLVERTPNPNGGAARIQMTEAGANELGMMAYRKPANDTPTKDKTT